MRLGEALSTCPCFSSSTVTPPQPKRAGRRSCDGSRTRASRSTLQRPAVRTSTPAGSRGSTAGSSRRSSGRWPQSGRAGMRASEPQGAGSPRSPPRTWRARARRSSSPTSGRGEFLAPLPLKLLPVDEAGARSSRSWGSRSSVSLLGCRARRGRTSGAGRPARLEPGERRFEHARSRAAPAAALGETLEFPEAVGNELTLRRSLAVLARPAARAAGAGRAGAARKLALSARLVGGGSWRRTITLRDADRRAVPIARGPGAEALYLPAPVVMLKLEPLVLAESTGQQLELVRPEGDELRTHLREGLRQVRARPVRDPSAPSSRSRRGRACQSKRALLVPRDE